MTKDLRALIASEAHAAGFDVSAIARLADFGVEAGQHLNTFLAEGRHGDMDWLASTIVRRRHPQQMWPEARTAILLGTSYAPERDPLSILGEVKRGAISIYAQGRDYHDVVKSRLKRVAGALQRTSGADVKVFVDTAPLMEKPLAMLAGLGWQGKHTNLVSREHGSWLFLGAILTTADTAPDEPGQDHCGHCRRCLDVCPTNAFPAPYQLDARRCISYLTIEHKGQIERSLRLPMGNRIYGCDDCLAVCPWNKFAQAGREVRFHARPETDNPPLEDLLGLDDATFRKRFAGTAVKRIGRDRFLRNVAIAAGNSGEQSLILQLEQLLSDESALVRGAAVWAIARLVPRARLQALAAKLYLHEQDASVRSEWQAEFAA